MAQDVAQTEEKPAVKRPVDQMLPVPKLAVYGFQHVLAFYAGAVIVPILLGSAIGLSPEQLAYLINADLFTCGIASIIGDNRLLEDWRPLAPASGCHLRRRVADDQHRAVRGRGVPGLRAIFGAVIIAGIVTFVVARSSPTSSAVPPVVTGTVITIIGVVLLSVAALDAGGGGASQFTEPPTFGALRNLALAAYSGVHPGALPVLQGLVATIAVLIGLVVGTAVGAIFVADFSRVADASWFGVTTPFHFGVPTFNPQPSSPWSSSC